MLEKFTKELPRIEEKINELTLRLATASGEEARKISINLALLEKVNDLLSEYKKTKEELEELEELESSEEDLEELIEEERKKLEEKITNLENEFINTLLDQEEETESIVLEIRAGTGGEEAALFAAELARMYLRYAEKMGWKASLADVSETGLGGFKEAIISIRGKGVYRKLMFESGVHRVQRVPVTESGGRIHTSAASVAVLPEPKDIEIDIKPEELKIETFRASGPGGQHMQKNETAVRITHIPTGIVVQSQSERSQHQNKELAMKILKARLKEYYESQIKSEISQKRKKMIGSGDRSEKIRTYNFPQNRVTDHRINLSLYNLPEILNGDLDELLEALEKANREKQIEEILEEIEKGKGLEKLLGVD